MILASNKSDFEIWAVFAGIFVLIGICSWFAGLLRRVKIYEEMKPRLDKVEAKEKEQIEQAKKLVDKSKAIDLIAKQKSVGFPWLAEAYADFHRLEEEAVASYLENKSHPAAKAAQEVRSAAFRRREAEREARIFRYQIKYYENLFPWLTELKGEDVPGEMIKINGGDAVDGDESDDPAKRWLTPEEFSKLPNSKKYELALERYWTKKKSKWEIGRDYERFIGYEYERRGYKGMYQGIVEGFDDLGRGLICEK